MDNNTFFTNENKDLLYNLCKDELFRITNYNIDENKKYYKTFGEIMKIVYKHSNDKVNLTLLNKAVLGKTIPYLQEDIEKKKLKNQPYLPDNQFKNSYPPKQINISNNNINTVPGNLPVSFRSQPTSIVHEKLGDLNKNLDQMVTERNSINKKNIENIDFSLKNNNSELGNPENLIKNNLRQREEINKEYNIPDGVNNQFKPNLQLQTENIQQYDFKNVSSNNTNNTNNTNKNEVKQIDNSQNLSLQPFEMEQSLSNQIKEQGSLETFNDDVDPMELYKKYNNERETELNNLEYNKIQDDKMVFDQASDVANQNINSVLNKKIEKSQEEENKFQESLSFKMNQMMNEQNVGEIKGQLDSRIQNIENEVQERNKAIDLPTADDLSIAQTNNIFEENKLFEKFKKSLFEERKYINRENLIIINSADRDWFNDTNENRYSFQVRFRPERDGKHRVMKIDSVTGDVARDSNGEPIYEMRTIKGEQGCGVESIYKNIVSFELVRVLMPVENTIIPFDNRIFIDYKSLPYIVLKIDEIGGLYSGTNSITNNTFAKLLWDKDHTSEVTQESKVYSRQYKRGFSSMAPMSFEKKTFYPSPLSSLNRLTISMETPYGKTIFNHPDSLLIKEIKYQDLSSLLALEITDSTCFPYNNSTGSYTHDKILEITTTYYFSNRMFRVGDNIQIKNFELDSSVTDTIDLEAFINRTEGHYIINLMAEDNTTGTGNQGFINKLYISPPGEINYSQETTTSILTNQSTYNTMNSNIKDTNNVCKVINKSLQTHFVFKIITREDDMTSVMNSSNI